MRSLRAGTARANAGPQGYTASWSSADQHPPAPTWFQDAKFGIYFHFGAFSALAYVVKLTRRCTTARPEVKDLHAERAMVPPGTKRQSLNVLKIITGKEIDLMPRGVGC